MIAQAARSGKHFDEAGEASQANSRHTELQPRINLVKQRGAEQFGPSHFFVLGSRPLEESYCQWHG